MQTERENFIGRFDDGYLYDKEVLVALLSNAFPKCDAVYVAEQLLTVFPSVSAVVNANYVNLISVKGVTKQIAEYFVVLGKVQNCETLPLKEVESVEALAKYGMKRCRGLDCEEAELYCVNSTGGVVAYHRYKTFQMKKVDMEVSAVAADITASGAFGFFLMHNHVYGNALPSEGDDIFTAKLLTVINGSGIILLDHCIVSKREAYSYRKSGRLRQLAYTICDYYGRHQDDMFADLEVNFDSDIIPKK